jgi:hypothetical protein
MLVHKPYRVAGARRGPDRSRCCAGCSSGPDEPTAPSASSGEAATVSATPAAAAAYSARHQATVEVANADGLVAVAGAVWVKTDDGRVVRVDPATNRVSGEVKVDTVADTYKHCQGIGTDGTAVWACATTDAGIDLVQIDPAALRIVRTVPVGTVFDQLTLPATSHGIWVLTADGTSVSVVEGTLHRLCQAT